MVIGIADAINVDTVACVYTILGLIVLQLVFQQR